MTSIIAILLTMPVPANRLRKTDDALRRCASALMLATALAGPAPAYGSQAVRESNSAPPAVQTGEASWYGRLHHGHRTASGEIFDMHRLTAAHPDLPLGSRVRVTNLKNHRSVEVYVNDRGPFVEGRIIDLSYAAAQRLGALSDGTVPVSVRVLSQPIG